MWQHFRIVLKTDGTQVLQWAASGVPWQDVPTIKQEDIELCDKCGLEECSFDCFRKHRPKEED